MQFPVSQIIFMITHTGVKEIEVKIILYPPNAFEGLSLVMEIAQGNIHIQGESTSTTKKTNSPSCS